MSLARVGPRYSGRREITALLQQLLNLYPDFVFAANDIHILIETPQKTLAEYAAHARAAATGRTVHHLFTGYLVAEAGEIKLLRETFTPLSMAQAQLLRMTAAGVRADRSSSPWQLTPYVFRYETPDQRNAACSRLKGCLLYTGMTAGPPRVPPACTYWNPAHHSRQRRQGRITLSKSAGPATVSGSLFSAKASA